VLGVIVNRAGQDAVDFLDAGGSMPVGSADHSSGTAQNGHVRTASGAWAGPQSIALVDGERDA